VRCHKKWLNLFNKYLLLVTFEADDNYLIWFEISNNSSAIRFEMKKNTIRTSASALVLCCVMLSVIGLRNATPKMPNYRASITWVSTVSVQIWLLSVVNCVVRMQRFLLSEKQSSLVRTYHPIIHLPFLLLTDCSAKVSLLITGR